MCGIFGYIGSREALPFLMEGLKKLEYRGYDSAGIATLDGELVVQKQVGKISDLEKYLDGLRAHGNVGIAHTRWATHGRPSQENSHPHTDCRKRIALVHNGIIENYLELREELVEKGHTFTSSTDTEVLAHLIELDYHGNLEKAVQSALRKVRGSYAIVVISQDEPDKLVAARSKSPLVIGLDESETFIASDILALVKYTPRVIMLGDNEVAVVEQNVVHVTDLWGSPKEKEVQFISWDPVSAEKGGFAHFMLKEIHEQPHVIRQTIAAYVNAKNFEIRFPDIGLTAEELRSIQRVVFTACGTSWHAGLVGEYLIEQFVRIPSETEYGAEFRYRDPVIDEKTLVVAISQSGETADTLAAVEEARKHGAKVITICNVQRSSMARESDGQIYTLAGPEIGVASTKAFTTQLVVVYLLALHLGQLKGKTTPEIVRDRLQQLFEVPEKVERVLQKESQIIALAEKYSHINNALYLGRGKGFPIALEGALKLKEISYIHAEGYPAGEMKHGPIALIDEKMPVVILAFPGRRYDKILGNIEEVKARGGIVIAIGSEDDRFLQQRADEVFTIPRTTESLSAILAVVPLQLLAYYVALERGCHVDQPRNLAKSVTVE